VNERGIVLVDWEGQIANPAMRFGIGAPEELRYPVQVVIHSDEARLYFDLPSETVPAGPRKALSITDAGAIAEFFVSIYPDRDTGDESHDLVLEYLDAAGRSGSQVVSVHVIDQDRDRPPEFEIHVDFSQDETGFYDDELARETVRRVAQDWAYFLGDMRLDQVGVGAELTWIWSPEGFTGGKFVTNTEAYTGFLLYAYGIQHDELRAGGEGSYDGGYQSSGGESYPLRRSGGVAVERRGNYHTLGWIVADLAEDWWLATNLSEVPADLYSIVHHEMGHALAFNRAYDRFVEYKTIGRVETDAVHEYQGSYPAIDDTDHLPGTLDRASRRGAFGNEYRGAMPQGRWLVTKLDLLSLQAAGYRLRDTSPFVPLSIGGELPDGTVDTPYDGGLAVSGGTPVYYWSVDDGELPDGLALDSYSGRITGVPAQAGIFDLTLRVRDYRDWDDGITRAVVLPIDR
jgi:hypothetical protein